jgi:hypothetical protein
MLSSNKTAQFVANRRRTTPTAVIELLKGIPIDVIHRGPRKKIHIIPDHRRCHGRVQVHAR